MKHFSGMGMIGQMYNQNIYCQGRWFIVRFRIRLFIAQVHVYKDICLAVAQFKKINNRLIVIL